MIRRAVRRSYWATCAAYVALNHLDAWRFRAGDIETGSGDAHAALDTDSSLAYLEEVFADYKRYGGVDRFSGRVAEVGPGDSCGVGLLFLEDGCDQVDLVDRYYTRRDVARQARIYRALFEAHPALADRLPAPDFTDERSFRGLLRHCGPEASGEEFFVRHRGYDAIVSRAVLEHLYDPVAALRRMAEALEPGGRLLHKVDLRDHGMFSNHFHELKFLEVPDRLYARMTRASGRPNRVLLHEYREALQAIGLEFTLLVTHLAGVGPIEPHLPYPAIPADARARSLDYVRGVRPRLARSLRSVADEDLSVAGVFLVARKPA